MKIRNAKYVASYDTLPKCPKDGKPEFAFIGRSNVGKSSMINMLTGQNALAKVSKSPGKTKMINYFDINGQWYLVDLPGVGYAKVSKVQRAKWKKMLESYLSLRETLHCTFMLVDASIPPQEIDLEFIDWLGKNLVPFALVFTKSDKASKSQKLVNIDKFKELMLRNWEQLPSIFITSAVKQDGRDDILDFIAKIIE